MNTKVQEKNTATELRRQGFSYNEILKVLPVAKSTLSNWLKDLPLTEDEKIVLKNRSNFNISRGRIKAAAANRKNRLNREKEQFIEAQKEFGVFKDDSLFLVGVALYWAEGTKGGSRFQFMNSDHRMITLMIVWCVKFLRLRLEDISLRLYIHKPYAHEKCEEFWSKTTGITLANFKKTIYKPSLLKVKKRPNYKGCMRIEPKGGIILLRKIKFWQKLAVGYLKQKEYDD